MILGCFPFIICIVYFYKNGFSCFVCSNMLQLIQTASGLHSDDVVMSHLPHSFSNCCLLHVGSVHPDSLRGHCGRSRKSDAEETLAYRSKMPSLHTKGLEQEGQVVEARSLKPPPPPSQTRHIADSKQTVAQIKAFVEQPQTFQARTIFQIRHNKLRLSTFIVNTPCIL